MHGGGVERQPRAQVALRAWGRHGVQGWVGRWLGRENGLMCGVGGVICVGTGRPCAQGGSGRVTSWVGGGGRVLVCRGGIVAQRTYSGDSIITCCPIGAAAVGGIGGEKEIRQERPLSSRSLCVSEG